MNLYFILPILLSAMSTFAAECLNISGTYDMKFYAGKPKCANGLKVEKSWFKYKQVKCKAVTYSKVYRLEDGTFCEGTKANFIADGQERSYGNPDVVSKLEIFSDKHVSTSRSLSTGSVSTSTKTLSLDGSLVVDDSSGFHEVYERVPIQ